MCLFNCIVYVIGVACMDNVKVKKNIKLDTIKNIRNMKYIFNEWKQKQGRCNYNR